MSTKRGLAIEGAFSAPTNETRAPWAWAFGRRGRPEGGWVGGWMNERRGWWRRRGQVCRHQFGLGAHSTRFMTPTPSTPHTLFVRYAGVDASARIITFPCAWRCVGGVCDSHDCVTRSLSLGANFAFSYQASGVGLQQNFDCLVEPLHNCWSSLNLVLKIQSVQWFWIWNACFFLG